MDVTTDSSEPRSASIERYRVLDTVVDAFDVHTFMAHLSEHVGTGTTHVIANHNLHSLALFERSAPLRTFYDVADAVFIDGMPVVWLARIEGQPARASHRIGVLDWIWPLAEQAERKSWTLLHLGSTDAVNERARHLLLARHPDLRLVTINGFFDPTPGSTENASILERIRVAAPDVLLVGMGMPRQEQWVLENLHDLPPAVVVTVGGIFGYLGGDRPTAPRWMGRMGLEWLFRLVTEPGRLWHRYLVEPIVLVRPVLRAFRRRR